MTKIELKKCLKKELSPLEQNEFEERIANDDFFNESIAGLKLWIENTKNVSVDELDKELSIKIDAIIKSNWLSHLISNRIKKAIMTEEEKIKHDKAIKEIKNSISGCFGDRDKIFALHKFDEDEAKSLRKVASQNFVTLKEMEDIAVGFLKSNDCHAQHIAEQSIKITKFFSKKLV